MARLRESLIIDEISFIEEPLGGNNLLTMKNMFYGLAAMLIGYKLIYSGKPVAELLGILLIVFIGFLVAYPKKSLTPESLLIGMLAYYLGFGSQTKSKEELRRKKIEEKKRKEELKKKTGAKKSTVPVIVNIINMLMSMLGRKRITNVKAPEEPKPMLTPQLTRQKPRKLALQFTWLDYTIIAIGLASGVFGVIIFNKAFWSLDVREVYISMIIIVVGFSASIERVLEKFLIKRWKYG
ncbi:hypothetical protein [Sulfurisphaera ohwakuensis]|uniref:hypothetical protein n=1 Tax=Sulfurisphaera ohwakuensis TaxID=69656 RepID=UPI0036F3B42E